MKNIFTPKSSRFTRLPLRLTVAAALLLGVAPAQHALALEKVSDKELAKQRGGAKYYTGTCNQHADFTACTIPAPAESATCAALNTTRNYRDIRHGYDYCSGNRLPNTATTGPCQRDLSSVNAVERRIYNNTRLAVDCVDAGLLMNYLFSSWYCPHEDCRAVGVAPGP